MPFGTWNGVHTHYRWDGNADGPVLIFSNSLGTDLRLWDEVVSRLGDRFHILRYDMRGHGLTDVPDGPYVFDDLADDLEAFIVAEDLKDVTICGLSIGGSVAQNLAVRQPERVAKIVLCDTAMVFGGENIWAERIEMISKIGMAKAAPAVLERWFTNDFRASNPELTNAYGHMVAQTPLEGYLNCCQALRVGDLTAIAAQINQPTLILVGDQDKATPPVLAEALNDMILSSTLKQIPNSGHIPCVEQPAYLAKQIADFV